MRQSMARPICCSRPLPALIRINLRRRSLPRCLPATLEVPFRDRQVWPWTRKRRGEFGILGSAENDEIVEIKVAVGWIVVHVESHLQSARVVPVHDLLHETVDPCVRIRIEGLSGDLDVLPLDMCNGGPQ